MKQGRIVKSDEEILEIIKNYKKIAILGMSPKAERDSNEVGLYLARAGYEITPVYPGGLKEIAGFKAVSGLNELESGSIEILDVFRKSEDVRAHLEEALVLKPKVFWMQLGVKDEETAARLIENGIDVVMDKCIKVEHARLCR